MSEFIPDKQVIALRDRMIELAVLDAAQALYRAYYDDANGLTYDGKPMPAWSDLASVVQHHWLAGVREILVPNPVVEMLRGLRIEEMSPLDAMTKLYELRRMAIESKRANQ